LASRIPGTDRWIRRDRHRGTHPPRYGYDVWLKHLSLLHKAGMREMPASVVELGPGPSLAVGVAAVLCGADRYLGIDAVRREVWPRVAGDIDALAALLAERMPLATSGWPPLEDCLDAGRFPRSALPDELLSRSLARERVAALRHASRDHRGRPSLRYEVAEHPSAVSAAHGDADLVLSHAVMQHVNDPRAIYEYALRALRPGGFSSHQVSLTAHHVAHEWNGHWAIPPLAWRLMQGDRDYFLNRLPCSAHLRLMREVGFEIVAVYRHQRGEGIRPDQLADPWKTLAPEDLLCDRLFLVARKPLA